MSILSLFYHNKLIRKTGICTCNLANQDRTAVRVASKDGLPAYINICQWKCRLQWTSYRLPCLDLSDCEGSYGQSRTSSMSTSGHASQYRLIMPPLV